MKKSRKKKVEENRKPWVAIVTLLVIAAVVISMVCIFSNKQSKPTTLTYEIISGFDISDDRFEHRGYYVSENVDDTGEVIITISSGLRTSGGYGISVEGVEFQGDDVRIRVKETRREINNAVIMVLTYPTVRVKFNKMPDKITVVDDNGGEFGKIGQL